MLKRWMLLLVTVLCIVPAAGCGNKKEEPTEVIEESAVDNPTADSDSIQSEIEELPPLVEEPAEEPEEETAQEEPVYGEAELVCSIPQGFKAHEGDEGLYVHKSYPNDLSSISYVISESSEDVSAISKEDYKKMLEEDFYEAYGDEVEVTINQYKNIKVDGRPGLKIKLSYEFKGIEYEELVYMIYNKEESHIVCYTQEKGGKWTQEFENSGDSISLKSK